jgi:hypothetical protein
LVNARSQSDVVFIVLTRAVLSAVRNTLSTLIVNQLQNALRQAVDLSLAVLKQAVLVVLIVRSRLPSAGVLRRGSRLGQLTNGGNENGRVANVVGELGVLGLEQLDNGLMLAYGTVRKTYPDSNVLECSVGAAEEANEVGVKTTVGLVPDSVERGVVLGSFARKVSKRSGTVALDLYTGRVGERDKNLADTHLEEPRLEVV